MKLALLVIATLVGQRMLGLPGAPAWWAELQLAMVWPVAAALLRFENRTLMGFVGLGLAWDVAVDAVLIGPGGIAWSAAAVVLGTGAAVVADRSPRAWFVFGAVGVVVVDLALRLALWPLGMATAPGAVSLARSALLTGTWCGLVGWARTWDVRQRWEQHRTSRLR